MTVNLINLLNMWINQQKNLIDIWSQYENKKF
jgi:hypothetical protein